MGLDIDFTDGHPPMRIGATTRITVSQKDASGGTTRVALSDVVFSFGPVVWGTVSATDEPGVGLLEIVELAESDDVLDDPVYTIDAELKKAGVQALRSKKHLRILPQQVEIALAFEVGRDGVYKRFQLSDLKQEVDWSLASVSDPEHHELFVRDGVPYLRLSSLKALPATVRITFPSGDQGSLVIEGDVQWWDPADPESKVPELEVERPAPEEEETSAAESQQEPEAEPESPDDDASEETVLEMPPPFPEDELLPPGEPLPADEAPALEERRGTERLNSPPRPVIQQPSPQALQAAALAQAQKELVEELNRVERYAASFSGALKRAAPEEAGKIRERITGKLQALRPKVEAYQGPGREELLARLDHALTSEA